MPEYKLRIVIEGRDNASGALGNVAGSLRRITEFAAGGLLARGITAIGGGISNAGKSALTAYADFERLQLSLQTLVAREMVAVGATADLQSGFEDSQPIVQDLIKWIEQLAILSPFKQSDIADSFRLAMAYGFTTEEAQRLTSVMTDFAAGSGATGDVMNRIALALGQIKARGKLAGQEIMQLTEAGIPVRQILADAFGVTTAELEEMQQAGISADAAIEAIISTLETDFAGAAEKQAGTFSGLLSSLSDIKEIGLREFIAGSAQAVQPYLESIVETLTDPAVQEAVRNLGMVVGDWLGESLAQANEALQTFAATFQEMGGGAEGVWAGLDAVFDSPEWLQNIHTMIEEWQAFFAEVDALIESIQTFDAQAWFGELTSPITTQVQEFIQPIQEVVAQIGTFFDRVQAIGDLIGMMGGPQALLGQMMPAFGEQPEWVTNLMNWRPSEPTWVISLTSWTVATPEWLESLLVWTPTIPGWVSDLLAWNPTMPDWVSNLVNWSPDKPQWVTSLINWKPSAPGWVNRLLSVLGGGGAQGNATGTSFFSGGATIVGERGPELVTLPRGSAVYSNQKTRQLMAGQMAPVVVQLNIDRIDNDLTAQSLAYRVADIIDRRQRAFA